MMDEEQTPKNHLLTCYLCLNQTSDELTILPEDEQLRMKMDNVFYFQVTRELESPCLVCDVCKETVDRFYEYAEQVFENQLYLPAVLNLPSCSAEPTDEISQVKQEHTNPIEDIQWVAGDDRSKTFEEQSGVKNYQRTYLETIIEPCHLGEEEISMVEGDVTDEEDIMDQKDMVFEEYKIIDQNDISMEESQSTGNENNATGDKFTSSNAISEDEELRQDEEHLDEVNKPKRKYTSKINQNIISPKAPAKIERKGCRSKDLPEEHSIQQLLKQFGHLSCDLCSASLKDFVDMRKHYRNAHKQQCYLKCCDKKIYEKFWMIQHIQLHVNPDAFRCDICNKSYSSSKVLRIHMEKVHSAPEDRPVKCETCLKQFISIGHLNTHIGVAHGSIPCPQCPRILASEGSLKKHLRVIHGEGDKYICDICSQVYRSKECFEAHIKRHLGTRIECKVQCGTCARWFTDKNCLTKHIRLMHVESEIVQTCEICSKQFRNQNALVVHKRRAHAESRFECHLCLMQFKRKLRLTEHMAMQHTGELPFECNFCSERFNTKNKRYMHRKFAHPVEWEEHLNKRMLKEV